MGAKGAPGAQGAGGADAGPARRAAERYFEAVNAGDLQGIAALFSEDSVLEHPAGTFIGRDAIAGFYRDSVLPLQTSLTPVTVFDTGEHCLAEFVGRSPLGDEVVYVCDVFRVNPDGTIAALRIYIR